MKTIAQQLGVEEFPFIIKDKRGNIIYIEDEDGWSKREWDSNNNEIYYENGTGYWYKQEYDSNGNEIYYEDSIGNIVDKRPKEVPEYTMEELTEMLGKEFKIKTN